MKKTILSIIAAVALCSCGTTAVSDIAGKSFILTELNSTELPVLDEQNPPMITFEGGRVSATVGFNSVFADYGTGRDGSLTLSKAGSTQMLSPEESREDEFIQAFNSIVSYSLDGDAVCFMDKDGNVLLRGVVR